MAKDWKKIILYLGFLVSFITITYSTFTAGQATFDSDTATATLLDMSILKYKSLFPVEWNYANGEIWVFSMHIFTFLPMLLMKNQVIARLLGSYQLAILAIITVIFQSKKSFKNNSWLITMPLVFVFLIAERDMLLYEGAYPMTIVVMCMCASCIGFLWDDPLKKAGIKYICLYAVIVFVECMMGLRYLAEQTIPMFGACVAIIFFDSIKAKKVEKSNLRKLAILAAIIILPAIMGFGLHQWLASWHEMNNTARNQLVLETSGAALLENTALAFRNFFENFGFIITESKFTFAGLGNLITIIVCILLCFLVPLLQLFKLKEEGLAVKLFFWFTVIHNLEMLVLAIFFSEKEYRYLLSAVLCCIILSGRYIYEYWIAPKDIKGFLWVAAFFIATLVQCINVYRCSAGWEDQVAYDRMVAQTLVDHNLTKGYASYWNAYKYQIFSDNKVTFGGAYLYPSGLEAYRWLVDDDVFEPEDKNTFLMLDEGQNSESRDYLDDVLGKPVETFKAGDYYVYVFDYDIVTQ